MTIVQKLLKEGPKSVVKWLTEVAEDKAALIGKFLEDFTGNLKTLVSSAVTNLIKKTIGPVIGKLISKFLGPVGVLGSLVDLAKTFLENCTLFGDMIKVIIDGLFSLKKCNAKSIEQVAARVTEILGRSVGPMLSAIAKLVGLGGLARKIKQVIQRLKDAVAKLVKKLIRELLKLLKNVVWPGGGGKPGPEGDGTCKIGEGKSSPAGQSGALGPNATAPANCECDSKNVTKRLTGRGGRFEVNADVVEGTERDANAKVCKIHSIRGPLKKTTGRGGGGPQRKMIDFLLGGKSSTYAAGHVIGDNIGGPNSTWNLVPMERAFNGGGGWFSMENRIAKCLGDSSINSMSMDVRLTYPASGKKMFVPKSITVTLTVNGHKKNPIEFKDTSKDDPQRFAGKTCTTSWT